MNASTWDAFFRSLSQIVNAEGSWKEKRDLVWQKADEYGCEGDLEEFLSWFDHDTQMSSNP